MALRIQQSLFVKLIGKLIEYAYANGYELTFGDAFATKGHSKNSKHYERLAIDLNLFKNGEYLQTTEDHRLLGDYWITLHPDCSWGGNFLNKDGNHYSMGEKTI